MLKLVMERRDITENEDPVVAEWKRKWIKEQAELKGLCSLEDTKPWQISRAVARSDCDLDAGKHTDSSDDVDDKKPSDSTDDVDDKKNSNSVDAVNDMSGSLDAVKDNESGSTDASSSAALMYVAGTDISFVKGDDVNACASLIVLRLPDLKVVYEDTSMVKMSVPYIPGFLAFREAPFFVAMFEKLKQTRPELTPQALLVDGNGILHTQEFGIASHIGVLLDIPSVGVGKTLFHVDGLENNEEHRNKIKLELKKAGDSFPLIGRSGKTYGVVKVGVEVGVEALRGPKGTNPIYVSQGHNVSLNTAVWLVQLCSRHRAPEPIRQADIRSREFLRKKAKESCNESEDD